MEEKLWESVGYLMCSLLRVVELEEKLNVVSILIVVHWVDQSALNSEWIDFI